MLLGWMMMFSLAFQDIHSFGNVNEVRTKHLSLDLTLDFAARVMTGTCAIDLEYADSEQRPAYVDLDARDLVIQKIMAGEQALRFELGPVQPFLGRRLRVFLPETGTDRLTVHYKTSPEAAALQWLTPAQTTSGKLPFLFSQSQSILARTWIPCMDSPGVRVTYDAVIRVPKGIQVVMSARHGAHQPQQGIFRFEMPLAIPPYLLAIAAGEMAFQPLSDRTGVYAEPAVLAKAAAEFEDMEEMIVVTEKLYGPYRWERWDTIVLPPSFPFGGMENPLLTFATPTVIAGDKSLVSLMAHELAHSWSGNLVTNATWSDFWLNEGFTTYIERRIVEAIYGPDVATMQKLLGQRDLRKSIKTMNHPDATILTIDLANQDPDDGMTDIPYEKGANFLLLLEKTFGRERFDTFLRNYFDHFAFESIDTDTFKAYLKKHLFEGDDAKWQSLQVEAWLHGPGIPENMVVPVSERFDKTRAAAAAVAKTGSMDAINPDWVTAEWLDFLNSLPKELDDKTITALDKQFKLSETGNSEILFAWLMVAIRNNYEPAYPALESFLTRMGRRKFLKPLYEAMMANPNTKAMAKRVYKKARPTYHPISVATIDQIVK